MSDLGLLDKDFLLALDSHYQREIYAKIVALDLNENPITELQGNVVSGSINSNGASAVRRTCSLTLTTHTGSVQDIDWALYTKFIVYIGLKNFVDPISYEDIIWFKQGVFVITSFSSTLNTQGYTISIQGKDKMCLLNGEVSGNLFAAHDFGKIYTTMSDGSIKKDYVPIKTIIREAVHTYAQEPFSNIFINDVDDCAVELVSYHNKSVSLWIIEYTLKDHTKTKNMVFSNSGLGIELEKAYQSGQFNSALPGVEYSYQGQVFSILKRASDGDTVGYRRTDLTYPDDLVVAVGGTVSSMLDSITKMLGEFEYFYDKEGHFIFQRKKIYLNIPWTNSVLNEREKYYNDYSGATPVQYEFNHGQLIESFANKPKINNIKNDFSVWGKMTGNGVEIPVHLRCAIDTKPSIYKSPRGKVYKNYQKFPADGHKETVLCDWREIIYQMASDNNWYRGQLEKGQNEAEYLQTWNTGYDAYYADMLGFWRELYDLEKWYETDGWNPDYVRKSPDNNSLYFPHPERMPFWIEFIDDTSELRKYSVRAIGRRSKAINDAKVKAIFFRETPQVLYLNSAGDKGDFYYQSGGLKKGNSDAEASMLSYSRMNIPKNMENFFTLSTQGKSAKEAMDNLIYNHTYYQESITLNSVPIYYLEPNVRISVADEKSGIFGEYIIQSYSISLSQGGMMSITATKVEDRIL